MKLRDYQQEAVDAVWACLEGQRGNPLVVLPTGAGKSPCIGALCQGAMQRDGRVLVLQHRKELIEQNAEKVKAFGVPVGLYSAGLNRKQINEPVILAGIQSCYRSALDFGRRHLVIIDEAHLTPPSGEGMYRTFLTELQSVNPRLKVVGLTATPFRTGEGSLVGGLWTEIAYEAQLQRLIRDGYLCPITNKPSATHYDTSALHLRGGEFIEGELAQLFGDEAKIQAAVDEVKRATVDRHSVIIFCSGVAHAERVAELIGGSVIHGGTLPLERSQTIEDFKRQRIKYLVNVDVLTTGFDAPNVDAVVILRATASAGLFAQICGRGLRLHQDKIDCLLLDFGNNFARFGPLDAIDYGKSKSSNGEGGDAPEKTCPGCDEAVPAGKRICNCGFIFPKPELKHDETADSSSAVLAEPVEFEVKDWYFSRHEKKGHPDAPNTLRVTYTATGNVGTTIEEWVCLNHSGFAGNKALRWWREHSDDDLDGIAELLRETGRGNDRIDAAIALEKDGQVRRPVKITAVKDGRWWRVLSRVVGELVKREEIPF